MRSVSFAHQKSSIPGDVDEMQSVSFAHQNASRSEDGCESRALGCPTAEFKLVGVEHYGNSSAEIIREHLGVLPADMDGHHPRLLGVTTEKGDSRGV